MADSYTVPLIYPAAHHLLDRASARAELPAELYESTAEFQPALEVLLASLRKDANLSSFGRIIVTEFLTQFLVTRLRYMHLLI